MRTAILPWVLFSILVVAVVLVALFAGIRLLSGIFAQSGGWNRLATRYSTDRQPAGQCFTGQTIKMGGLVRYRNCITVCVSPEGLYLALVSAVLPKQPPLLIPWSEITGVEPTRLYWWKAARLSIGQPQVGTVDMWLPLFQSLRPFLDPAIIHGL